MTSVVAAHAAADREGDAPRRAQHERSLTPARALAPKPPIRAGVQRQAKIAGDEAAGSQAQRNAQVRAVSEQGLQLGLGGGFGSNDTKFFGVTLGIDFARLTVFRTTGETWFPNPYPAYRKVD